jgi:hypothetical protein
VKGEAIISSPGLEVLKMIIPVGAIIRLIRWTFTKPLHALRFFLMLAVVLLAFWSFFSVALAYAGAAESHSATLSEHIVFYAVSIVDVAGLLALPFFLQLYDRLFRLPPVHESIGCLILLGLLALPCLILWVVIGLHPKVVADLEGTIMGSLLFLALGACAFLAVRSMRKRQREHRLDQLAQRINHAGKPAPHSQ